MKLFRKSLSVMFVFLFVLTSIYSVNVKAEENEIDAKQKSGLEFFNSIGEDINIDHYGGAYFDDYGNLVLQYKDYDLLSKDNSDGAVNRALETDFVSVKHVTYSYKELRAFLNILIEKIDFKKMGVGALDIDIINNKVQIFINELDNAKIKTISLLVPVDAIDFVEGEVINTFDIETNDNSLQKQVLSNRAASTLTLAAGQKVKFGINSSATMFLPGFQWSSSSGTIEYGFMTAGHITVSVGANIYDANDNLIGTVSKKIQTNSVDMAFIKRNPNYTFNCSFLDGASTVSMWALEEDYGIPVNTNITVYSYLGNVSGSLVSNNYTYVNGYTIWSNMIRTTADTEPGYSGAPVAVNDSSVSNNKVVIGYHKGRAVVNGTVYAFHGNMYYVKMEDLTWSSAGTDW